MSDRRTKGQEKKNTVCVCVYNCALMCPTAHVPPCKALWPPGETTACGLAHN